MRQQGSSTCSDEQEPVLSSHYSLPARGFTCVINNEEVAKNLLFKRG